MHNFMTGFAFVASIAALVLAYVTHAKVRRVLYVVNNKNTRTVTVNHADGNITIIKEYKNASTVIDA